MKLKLRILTLFILLSGLTFGQDINTAETKSVDLEIPKPEAYVNDYAFLLNQSQRNKLERKLRKFDQKTTNQIVVLTIDSDKLDEENFEEFAIDLSNSWGVGVAGKDNGLTIILSPTLRKIRISTGFGTRKIITDEMCVDIIERLIVPEFQKGNYYNGLSKAIDEIIGVWK